MRTKHTILLIALPAFLAASHIEAISYVGRVRTKLANIAQSCNTTTLLRIAKKYPYCCIGLCIAAILYVKPGIILRPARRPLSFIKKVVRRTLLRHWRGNKDTQLEVHAAVIEGDLAKIQRLISLGRNINTEDAAKQTPLHVAVQTNQINVVRCLLECMAESDLIDIAGNTPLHIAIRLNLSPITRILLEHDADTGTPDTKGNTPLHLAAQTGNTQIAELLLQHGASANAQNNAHQTPWQTAVSCQHARVALLLDPTKMKQLVNHNTMRACTATITRLNIAQNRFTKLLFKISRKIFRF